MQESSERLSKEIRKTEDFYKKNVEGCMKLLDTSAWVEYFKGSEKGRKVASFLEEEPCFTCALTLAEISRWFVENNHDIDFAVEQIKQNSVLIMFEEKVLVEAGKNYPSLRKISKAISMIDVIIFITAYFHELTLITTDSDFRNLQGVEML